MRHALVLLCRHALRGIFMPPIFGFYLNYLFVLFLIVLHGDGKISEASSCAGVYKFVS